MGQDRTCYGTCTCKPLDTTQPPQAMHKRSWPSPTCMASMIYMRESNLATSNPLFVVCRGHDYVSLLLFLPNASFVLPLCSFHLLCFPVLDLDAHVLLNINITPTLKLRVYFKYTDSVTLFFMLSFNHRLFYNKNYYFLY